MLKQLLNFKNSLENCLNNFFKILLASKNVFN